MRAYGTLAFAPIAGDMHITARTLCAAWALAIAGAPAPAAADSAIHDRLARAGVALDRAHDALDRGAEARVLSSLRGVNRQTGLAVRATLLLVSRNRRDADIALAATAAQLAVNAQTVSDMLVEASPPMAGAINATLAAVDAARRQILVTIEGLGDLGPDWADALTELADDAVAEVAIAADAHERLPHWGHDILNTSVTRTTGTAGALLDAIVVLAEDGDAALGAELLAILAEDAADAAHALGGVPGLGAAATRLDALAATAAALADEVDAYADESYWAE